MNAQGRGPSRPSATKWNRSEAVDYNWYPTPYFRRRRGVIGVPEARPSIGVVVAQCCEQRALLDADEAGSRVVRRRGDRLSLSTRQLLFRPSRHW